MKRFDRVIPLAVAAVLCLMFAQEAAGAFGLTTHTDYYTVDTGAGLVFEVRRVEEAGANPNTISVGDIRSLVYNGVEYQDTARGSQINSGFDYLGYSNSAVNVTAEVVNTDFIKITVTTANLVHYYIVRNGYPHIYMATWFDVQPVTGGGLCRYIVRMPYSNLPNGPEPSDLSGTTDTVESGDIFGMPNGITRSKHYSNHRLVDWSYTGATGNGVGVFMVRDSQEGGSGGPFYRSLINQGGGDQEITYILNYGQTQTEAFRAEVLNGLYALVFTDGHPPDPNIDYSWVDSAGLNLIDWVPQSGRGAVSGIVSGIPDGFEAVMGFANANAQYWARADADGSYITQPMIPGVYTATLYKQELQVATDSVMVSAGATSSLDIASNESAPAILWRLGDRDGTPEGFMNADKTTWMHPSDVRMNDWNLGIFVVGSSTPKTAIPCYQWKDIAGGSQTIQFELTAAQVVNTTVNIGITVAHEGGRPNIEVNGSWTSPLQGPSAQPNTRSLTTGTYRGNNVIHTFSVPSSALTPGINTLRIYPISGTTSFGFLSPGYSLDHVEWLGTPSALPDAPSGAFTETSDLQVDLKWDPIPSAMHYVVRRAAIADGPYTLLSDTVGPAHYTDTTPTNGTTYFYRVSAVNALGQGAAAELSATPSQLVTHFKFDESSGTTALDSVGGDDGTLMSGASWTAGQIGNAVQLDGSTNGYVELPDGIVQDLTNCTFSTWVNATATPTWSRIFDFGMGAESYMFLSPNADNGGGGTVRFAITVATSGGEEQLNSGSPLSLTGWHHVAVTLSGDTGTLYIDGSVADTQTIMLDPADLGLSRQNYIGKSQWPDPYPTAQIDDFRIYGRALSPGEIATMASQTPPSAPSSLMASVITNEVMLTWSASSGANTYNVKRAATSAGPYNLVAGGVTSTSLTFDSMLDGTNYFVVSASNIAGESLDSVEASAFVVVPEPPLPPVVPVAYYRFEEGLAASPVPPGANVVVDTSGGNDNMNAYDTAAAPDYSASVPVATIPQTGQPNTLSTYYDGSDDLYTALSGPFTTTAFSNFTAEAFVNFSSLSGFQTIVGRDDEWNQTGGLDGDARALFYLSKHSDNHFRVEVSTVGGNIINVEGSAFAALGTWYHVAAVGDVATGMLTLYVNGVSVGSVGGFDGLFPASGKAWTIGRGQFNGGLADNLTGYIDEVRFTASVLSPNQFLNAFNPDTDADGLTDAWEIAQFGNLGQIGTDDPDGDGVDNETEETNGTDPTISSVPPIISVAVNGGLLRLEWPLHHTGWRLQTQTNGASSNWFDVVGSPSTNSVWLPVDLHNSSVFHRLIYP